MPKTTSKKAVKKAKSVKNAAVAKAVDKAGSSGLAVPIPHIGAYVLETLTLGMYGEPRHTIREYVQNAYDSIRAAKKVKGLAVVAADRKLTSRTD